LDFASHELSKPLEAGLTQIARGSIGCCLEKKMAAKAAVGRSIWIQVTDVSGLDQVVAVVLTRNAWNLDGI
jgi:hypothetical protein